MTEPLLAVRGVKAFYGAIMALKGIDLDVNEGEIVTLIGANGAGKSTTLRAISGLVRASGGAIGFRGEPLVGRKSHEIVALGISHVIFGDIMYDSNREFPERVCAASGLLAVEPLWGEPTDRLYREFVETGADARIVTVRDSVLDASWLGRRLTLGLLPQLVATGADACGEHGEYHTVVVDAPAFSSPIDFVPLDHVARHGCWALDFSIDDGSPDTRHVARV